MSTDAPTRSQETPVVRSAEEIQQAAMIALHKLLVALDQFQDHENDALWNREAEFTPTPFARDLLCRASDFTGAVSVEMAALDTSRKGSEYGSSVAWDLVGHAKTVSFLVHAGLRELGQQDEAYTSSWIAGMRTLVDTICALPYMDPDPEEPTLREAKGVAHV